MKVTVKSTTMVQPAERMRRHSLWLSNLDLLQLRSHVTRVISAYNKPASSSSSESCFFDTKVVKEALSKTLVPFYPVAGRLRRRDGNGGRLELDCNDEGVLFQEAESEAVLAEVKELLLMADGLEFSPGEEAELLELFPRVDYSKGVSSYPLLIVQVTRFKCGGICLGIGIHHALADGESSVSFINTWADMARGLPVEATLFWDRTILRARRPVTPEFHHVEYDPDPTMMITDNNPPKPAATVAILKITAEQLNTLKDRAMARSRYSTYEILTSHIWRCAIKARGLVNEQPTKLHISLDGRSRLSPPLPAAVALAGELASEPLPRTLERIQQALSRMDDEYLRSAIDYLEDPNNPEGIIQVQTHCRSPNLWVVSWMRFPFKTADFGWGSSTLFHVADISEGMGILLPRNPADGSLSLAICLESDVMEGFKKMFYEFDP
ncbi:unnamed protein product [Linum tenue]|uniref:Uncharacterized protein n=1 Tax=Linum tenue TaxID=586396 RepID=A0AAV0IAV7_9ROSI|nr:unnamed protein product [Linum tenue]